jgi:phage-related minor tail protein
MTSRVLDIRVKVDAEKGLVEFSRLGDQGSKALLRIQNAAQPANTAFKALTAAGTEVRGQIEGMASRLGPLGSALSAIGPYGLIAGAAIAGVTAALTAGIREIAEFEKAFFKVEAILKATGNTTGLTSSQIKQLSQDISGVTLATEEQALGASAALASFGNVAGQNFGRVLKLGQDLAATFGGDIQSQVVGIAKALEDPADNMRSLGDAAKYFTDAQKEAIKVLVDSGNQAQAVELILKTLESRVGGTGEAEAKGLVGAADQLSKSWKDLLKVIADTR